MRQTDACGQFPECQPSGGLFAESTRPADGEARSAGWSDLDPHALPRMFGATAAGMVAAAVDDVSGLERALAAAFLDVIAPLLAFNARCGRSAVCRATPTFPIPIRAARS